jgi:hypothetical protein
MQYRLELGGEVVATIVASGYEFPWTYGRLVNSPEFERFRTYFTDDNDWPENDSDLEVLCGDVQAHGRFRIRDLSSGVAYQGVCLNHDGGDGVWFRHGDPA